MYKCVLFDMDGTLINTYEGIFNSYKYAFEKMNLEFPRDEFVGEVIGAPLLSVFKDRLLLSEENAQKATEHYREYYSSKGKNEAEVYEGMDEVLTSLKKRGILIGIATLKREDFAREILHNLKLNQYFDVVYGIDDNDKMSKADLLELCMKELKVRKKDTILIGDSKYDFLGAKQVNIDFMAVTYGFGFKIDESFNIRETDMVAKSVKEIIKLL